MPGVVFDGPRERSSVLGVLSYDVVVDLTGGEETFRSRTELDFTCRHQGATVFADLQARAVRRALLNGEELPDRNLRDDGRLELPGLASQNRLIVEAQFDYVRAGGGICRVDAGDGVECTYSKANYGGAARIFCCFDQPDLRAPISLAVRAPDGWLVRANFPMIAGPAEVPERLWRFERTSALAPYLLSLCAAPRQGTYLSVPVDDHDALSLTIWAPAAPGRNAEAEAIAELVGPTLGFYERSFRGPFPYPKYDLVFVPGLAPLAYSPPGLAVLQDRLLDQSEADTSAFLACVTAHELAHSWFGGLVDMRSEQHMWLQEALATYVSRSALEATGRCHNPWDPATSPFLPDHAYSNDAALLKQLEEMIGRPALMDGLGAVMAKHHHATITLDDLAEAWSDTSGRDLHPWAARTLTPAARPPHTPQRRNDSALADHTHTHLAARPL